MQVSNETIEKIKEWEGFCAKPYLCPSGKMTIGHGHTQNVVETDIVTKEKADELLRLDLKPIEKYLTKLARDVIPLNQKQFDALASLIFNIGLGAFQRSTLLKHIINKAKDYLIRAAWLSWCKVRTNKGTTELRGLSRRREWEASLYLEEESQDTPTRTPTRT